MPNFGFCATPSGGARRKAICPRVSSWAHLFRSPDRGRALAHVTIGVGAIAGLFIAGGILSLRMIVEDPVREFVYGLLALGITLASAVNSYFYADEVADKIDAAAAAWHRR